MSDTFVAISFLRMFTIYLLSPYFPTCLVTACIRHKKRTVLTLGSRYPGKPHQVKTAHILEHLATLLGTQHRHTMFTVLRWLKPVCSQISARVTSNVVQTEAMHTVQTTYCHGVGSLC